MSQGGVKNAAFVPDPPSYAAATAATTAAAGRAWPSTPCPNAEQPSCAVHLHAPVHLHAGSLELPATNGPYYQAQPDYSANIRRIAPTNLTLQRRMDGALRGVACGLITAAVVVTVVVALILFIALYVVNEALAHGVTLTTTKSTTEGYDKPSLSWNMTSESVK